jgi:hypothetical protein
MELVSSITTGSVGSGVGIEDGETSGSGETVGSGSGETVGSGCGVNEGSG